MEEAGGGRTLQSMLGTGLGLRARLGGTWAYQGPGAGAQGIRATRLGAVVRRPRQPCGGRSGNGEKWVGRGALRR